MTNTMERESNLGTITLYNMRETSLMAKRLVKESFNLVAISMKVTLLMDNSKVRASISSLNHNRFMKEILV